MQTGKAEGWPNIGLSERDAAERGVHWSSCRILRGPQSTFLLSFLLILLVMLGNLKEWGQVESLGCVRRWKSYQLTSVLSGSSGFGEDSSACMLRRTVLI